MPAVASTIPISRRTIALPAIGTQRGSAPRSIASRTTRAAGVIAMPTVAATTDQTAGEATRASNGRACAYPTVGSP